MTSILKSPSSFRDVSGFVYFQDQHVYRQINIVYKEHYDCLMGSGLYQTIMSAGLLVSHKEVESLGAKDAYKIIKPETIPFISYPYEWCFSQLKDAALTTLNIQKMALNSGMSLKDCSAYNIQFLRGRPVFIDTLSFERYREGRPWVAYRQFCQHFLAPLTLMSHTDIRLSRLSQLFIDGVPLDLAATLLPFRTKLTFSSLAHIHLHSRSQKVFSDKVPDKKDYKMTRRGMFALVDNLEAAVRKLSWRPKGTEWADYYKNTNYTDKAFGHKGQIVAEYLDITKPKYVWDLGANTGLFSRIASDRGIETISFDLDPAAVEKNYQECVKRGETRVLPLLLDLTNPSPAIGWDNEERASLTKRGPVDMVFALALVHHLAISNNLPFSHIVGFFSKICSSLIIEFVPKNDSQVQRLLRTREDVFPDYTKEMFEAEFSKSFVIRDSKQVRNSERTVYLMTKRGQS